MSLTEANSVFEYKKETFEMLMKNSEYQRIIKPT